MMFSGLPDARACSAKIGRSRSTTAGSSWSAVDGLRVGGRDVHRQLLAELGELRRLARGLPGHEHAELAEARRQLVVQVAGDAPLPAPRDRRCGAG